MAEQRNPLSIAFGRVIRDIRNEVGLQIREAAAEAEIEPSFLTSVENGISNLHPNKSFALAKAYPSLIDVVGLERFLALLSYLESQSKKLAKKTADGPHLRYMGPILMELQAQESSQLGVLIQRFVDTDFYAEFDELTPSEAAQLLESKGIIGAIDEFVRSYSEFGASGAGSFESALNEAIGSLPSVYLELVEHTVAGIKSLPEAIGLQSIWAWEEEHISQLRELVIVVLKEKFVINPKNLQNYQYTCLWHKSFQKVTFIMGTKKSKDELREEFLKVFKDVLAKQGEEARLTKLDSISRKMEFIAIHDKADGDLLHNFDRILNGHDAYWAFDLETKATGMKMKVGFSGDMDDTSPKKSLIGQAISLGHKELMWREELVDRLKRGVSGELPR